MTSFLTPPARLDREERIDSGDPTDAQFAGTFADIARVNRFLGGTRAVLTALTPLMRALPVPASPVRILDIATGSADIPRALVRAARRGQFGPNRRLEIVATDNHPKVRALAERLTPSSAYPEIMIGAADAFRLPYADGAFDFALCSLAFHHFGPENCVHALREMERVTTRGFIVNDLRRDRLASALMRVTCRLVRAHPFTCHDAPLSVLRAYTPNEYAAMVQEAGMRHGVTVRCVPMYRVVIVRSKMAPTPGPSPATGEGSSISRSFHGSG